MKLKANYIKALRALKKKVPLLRLTLIVLILAVLSCGIYEYLHGKAVPYAYESLETVAKGKIEEITVSASERAINSLEGQLMIKTFNESGQIIAYEKNSALVNKLVSSVLDEINGSVKSLGCVRVRVPVGNVMKNSALHGLGPCVTVRATPYVAAYASVESSFTEAGINQTLHKTLLKIKTDVTVVCDSKTVSFTSVNDITVSEEIIIGSVPSGVIRQ